MMKVKPFSYHIPRRKAHIIIRNSSYPTNYVHSQGISIPSLQTVSIFRIRTVLILVLLAFIEVTGQGKLSEMDESSTFSTQDPFPDKSLGSLSNLEALKEEDDDDVALQHRISSMGYYGAKYRNNSFVYNYSSHTHPHYRSSTLHNPEYKLQVIGTSLSASHENPMSLDDQRSRTNVSDEFDGNAISQRSTRNEENHKENHHHTENKKNIVKKLVPNETSSEYFLNAKRSTGSRTKSVLHDHKKERDEDEDHIDYLSKMTFPSSREENEEDDEYDDDIFLDKFIPGNSTHLSGRHRFRQGSQAEVDEASGDGNSLVSTSRRRPRRSVVHLYDMVVCSTGCNPLIFKGYGCYCGFLGSGLTVDGIDKCCAKHDWCYHHAKCPPLLTYFVPYYWRCDHGRPECVTDFRGWKGVCGAHLCECDRQFAECLKKFPCPRSRAMCVTSPWSQWHADPRTFPFAVSRRPPRIPLLPYPFGRIFP